jgi:preprotein translocase subunit Sss1
MDSPRRFEPLYSSHPEPKKDLLESFKENPIGLILLGIVIGYIISNMRPIVFQAK